MFLNLLDDDEKHAFAVLAERMIEKDGVVIGREAAAVAALRAEMGVTRVRDLERGVAELAQTFGNRRSKIAVLLELIGLGYSDTNFSVTEKSLVSEVAKEMGIDAIELGRLEGWVQDHVQLIRRALVLMRD